MPAARPAVRTGRVIASPAPARCARQLCPNDRTSLRPIGLSGSKQTGPGIRKLTVARPQGSVAFWDYPPPGAQSPRYHLPAKTHPAPLRHCLRATSFAPLTATRQNQLNSHNIYGIAPAVNSHLVGRQFRRLRTITRIPGRVASPRCVSFPKQAWVELPKRSRRLPASTRRYWSELPWDAVQSYCGNGSPIALLPTSG